MLYSIGYSIDLLSAFFGDYFIVFVSLLSVSHVDYNIFNNSCSGLQSNDYE